MVEQKLVYKKTSPAKLLLSMLALGAGAYHGYCSAQGIPMQSESLHNFVAYGPTALRAAYSAIGPALLGFVGGGAGGAAAGRTGIESLVLGGGGAAVGTLGGAAIGGAVGAIKGGLQTIVGYGIGYVAGKIVS
jgi:hypothetical protein